MVKGRKLTLGDVMTPSPLTIPIHATLSEAKAQMDDLRVNHLPVMDGTLVESVISNEDIKRFTLPAHRIKMGEELLVSDIAPARAFAADINDPLEKVVGVMAERRMGVVIALNQGELAGIFTETDACRVLTALLADQE
ncbi:MAG: CBS domain-containing protein [Porticoccaceae bacterium]|jgi:acetoin utilization protein AcuB